MNKNKHFKIGDRVKVSDNYYWAKNEIGKISKRSFTIDGEEQSENYYRNVQTFKGKITFFWVVFDEPQIDADGDGPYFEAEIESKYLESIN